MRIAIVTSGRFHALDLARELAALGHDVRFYSMLDRRRTRAFGLPDACNRWLGPLPAGIAAVHRRLARRLSWRQGQTIQRLLAESVDRLAATRLEPCDVLIGMSGMSLRAMRRAKSRYGAFTVCERSSQHILAQRDILRAMPGRPPNAPDPVPDFAVRHELAQYEEADLISVLSEHTVRSFEARGVRRERLFRNPPGTDLTIFRPTPAPPAGRRRVVMAGTWSLQKGCDVLANAWSRLPAAPATELVHVGPAGDAPMPLGQAGFNDAGYVPQSELPRHYAGANVFCLASRQEGFGVVLVQALACGLRLVCTDRTGGEDLAALLDDPSVVTVVPPDDPDALTRALETALDASARDTGVRDLLGSARHHLSWAAYGRRWDERLRQIQA